MYTSDELNTATQQMVDACHKHSIILGIFLFGTDRVGEFLGKVSCSFCDSVCACACSCISCVVFVKYAYACVV